MIEDVTTMDMNGRVTIPAKVRKEMGLKKGQMFKVEVVDGAIRLVPVKVTVCPD